MPSKSGLLRSCRSPHPTRGEGAARPGVRVERSAGRPVVGVVLGALALVGKCAHAELVDEHVRNVRDHESEQPEPEVRLHTDAVTHEHQHEGDAQYPEYPHPADSEDVFGLGRVAVDGPVSVIHLHLTIPIVD